MQQHPVKAVILIGTAPLFQTIFVTAQQVKRNQINASRMGANYQYYRIAGNLTMWAPMTWPVI